MHSLVPAGSEWRSLALTVIRWRSLAPKSFPKKPYIPIHSTANCLDLLSAIQAVLNEVRRTPAHWTSRISKELGMENAKGGNGNRPPHEDAVDSRTAAAFLGIHYKTLERMARMGQVPAMKLGKEWQFLLSLLSEWREGQMNSNLNTHRPSNDDKQKESENY